MEKKRNSNDPQPRPRPSEIWMTHAVSDAAKRDWLNSPSKKPAGDRAHQRGDLRKTIPCQVLVRTGATFVLASQVHDISLTGAFVEMDSTHLNIGDSVEVVISFVYNQRSIEHPVSAEVVRLDVQGAGFRFNSYSNQIYTDLVNLLHTR